MIIVICSILDRMGKFDEIHGLFIHIGSNGFNFGTKLPIAAMQCRTDK